MAEQSIPVRNEVKSEDTWDLSKLFNNDDEWEKSLGEFEKLLEKIPAFKGTLGESAGKLAEWLDFIKNTGILEEKLGYYSMLRQSEDEGNNKARAMTGKYTMTAAKIQAASAFASPEIMAIPDEKMGEFMKNTVLGEYLIYLDRLLRQKPHILSDREERIMAMHSEGEGTLSSTFSVLTNVDFDFGTIETKEGKWPLSQSTWTVFMENPDRELRSHVYKTFYNKFETHKNALANLYAGQVKQNAIKARLRGHSSYRAMALFPDNVDIKVYDNLINSVGNNLHHLHKYYSLRKKILKIPDLRHYDVYAPLVTVPMDGGAKKKTSWNEAVELINEALKPLGDEYTETLKKGLLGRWADRYENKGKSSGAFSAGSFTGDPYILMNYKDDSVRDIFTLAHEGGHSMHSYYAAKNNPFMHYDYTIFEAEVASTFNEELLFRYMLNKADASRDEGLKLYLINKRIDEILGTLFRQTMFAEFEKTTHELEEGGEPLTVDVIRGVYRKLLEKYFGSEMVLEAESDLECLRIPHFYRAFYVYKYSTGISASLAMAERVLTGGNKEREDYFSFLKSGGSRFPIDAIKLAGVDMSSPAPIEAACAAFGKLVTELEGLLSLN